jgi:hypothetical protein
MFLRKVGWTTRRYIPEDNTLQIMNLFARWLQSINGEGILHSSDERHFHVPSPHHTNINLIREDSS